MKIDEIKILMAKALPGVTFKPVRESLLIENAADLVKVAQWIKDSSDLRMDYLSSVTGADYLTFLEVVYHFYSMEKKGNALVLRVRTADRENARLPSLTPLFRGAEYQEREVFDMYGIVFENHPDLRRIFMWEGFEGFPMRKDYIQEDSETLEMSDVEWLEKKGIPVPADIRTKAEILKQEGKRAVAEREGKET